jgi:hypothetical protein
MSERERRHHEQHLSDERPRVSRPIDRDHGGQPLASDIQREMESRFGHDFGSVRVWPSSLADIPAESLGAAAYALGQDLVFAPGAYAPDTNDGRFLLAHELAHVVQQAGAPEPTADDDVVVGEERSDAESDATAAAADAVAGRPASVGISTNPMVARGVVSPNKFDLARKGGYALVPGPIDVAKIPAPASGGPMPYPVLPSIASAPAASSAKKPATGQAVESSQSTASHGNEPGTLKETVSGAASGQPTYVSYGSRVILENPGLLRRKT